MDRRTERELYERELRRDAEISRNTASTNTALIIVLFLAAITAIGAVFFVTNRQSEPQAPQPQSPNINIEVPEPQAPQVQPPEVNINVPEVNIPEVNAPGSGASSEAENSQPAPTSESPQQ
ncbi:hypothetical protein [Egbenema bharatensis]|uniref:hypothetical protein n=1 Tax=Egbenema bharatensis TaxID=3463334 RepID=UPI003A838B99